MKRSLLDIKLRAYSAGDLNHFVRIGNAANEADGIDERSSEAVLANWLLTDRANYRPADDIVVATVDGQMAGYGFVDWVETSEGTREYRTRGHVEPSWRRQGGGAA